ncbi:MAG: hypothetical protein ABIY52_05620 [Gemmatimonadaceae bacterium]
MRRVSSWIALALSIAGCKTSKPEDSYVRGHGLAVATLPAGAEPQIVDAAIRAAFDVTPDLFLRMHVRALPRTAGDTGGAPISPSLVRALRERGLVLGTCEPVRSAPKDTPRCSGPEAGYIIRATDVLQLLPDTVEVYVAAEKFGAATGLKPEALRFEKIYQVVKQGAGWRVAREARAKP